MIITPNQDFITEEGHNVPTKVLTVNRPYFVYAVEASSKESIYYIMDDQHKDFPVPYSAGKFTVVDSTYPSNWVAKKRGWGPFKKEFSSFAEWAEDLGSQGRPGFYERLIDAKPGSAERGRMEEFYNTSLLELEKVK